jgi:hypothetical protein
MYLMKKNLLFAFIGISLTLLTSTIKAQTIPENRRVDWTAAGYQGSKPTYSNVRNITNFGGSGDGVAPNDAALQASIVSLGADSGIIYFPAGTYSFISTITLRSGIVLKGQDASATTLQFNLAGANSLINISGSSTHDTANVTSTVYKNQNSVSADNPDLFKADDYVKMFQNDSALVNDAFALTTVGQILRIQNITGNTITFYHPLRKDYVITDAPRLTRLIMTTGVGIECLKIKRIDSTIAQTANIFFNNAAQCWIKGVESDSCNFAHVQIDNSTNIEITGSYFHGSFGYGGGGQGYGIAAEFTSGECLIENNIFKHLRHAMLLQAGSNGNVFTYNYSREPFKSESSPFDLSGDIVLHGNYPYANLFEGNIVQNIVIDASHKINGPYNTFFRNRAESYGILMSPGSGDSTNIVGNEITGTGSNKGNYITSGNGNFQYGNNINGTIVPFGTTSLTDNSYYYNRTPAFWNVASPWPPIGIPNNINAGTIPAKQRFDAGANPTICAQGTALPVHLFAFSIKQTGDKNIISWQAENMGLEKFEIERSNDGGHFTKIGETSGTTYGTNRYDFVDEKPVNDINYYRIKEISKSASITYSNMLSVNNRSLNTIKIFPNPANDHITITLSADVPNLYATVKNSAGSVMLKQGFTLFGNKTFTLNINGLLPGMYILEMKNLQTGIITIQKFIKK